MRGARGDKAARPVQYTALQQFSMDVIEIVHRCRPAVATIRGENERGTSSGSGFLVDAAGNVVTNNHVVDGCSSHLQIQFSHDMAQSATLVGTDPLANLAFVSAPAPLASPLPIRTETAVLAEICLTIGSPLGEYTESVSTGIVSGL